MRSAAARSAKLISASVAPARSGVGSGGRFCTRSISPDCYAGVCIPSHSGSLLSDCDPGRHQPPLAIPPVKHRILIADDEPDMLELVCSSFTSAGFNVLRATDGTAALNEAQREKPSLIVLDIMMPGLTGLEVTRALKRDTATASIPIMLLSARTQEIDRILGLELGADDFVTKPFSPRELVLRATSILRRKCGAVSESTVFRVGAIELDEERHLASANRNGLTLTAIEFSVWGFPEIASGR